MHTNYSVLLHCGGGVGRRDPLAEVKAMLRPCDDCYVIDNKDPTAAIAAAVERLRAAGISSFVYARGDDWMHFPGRDWLEANEVEVRFFKYTEAGGGVENRRVEKRKSRSPRERTA